MRTSSFLIIALLLAAKARASAQSRAGHHAPKAASSETSQQKTSYICPMHPNIKQSEPGSCPICGMTLVPTKGEGSLEDRDEGSIRISQASRRLAGIETETVKETIAYQVIRAVSSVDFDEGRISTIAAYVDGRIEKLYANYMGVKVKTGEHLAKIYSPALYSAQVEYLQAGSTLGKMRYSQIGSTLSTQRALLVNAKRKLKELGMSNAQIDMLKKTRKAKSRLVMNSPVSGTVIQKNAIEGSYVKAGQIIYKVADLSTVWLLLDMFPEETAFLKFGLKVKARVRSAPGQVFEGRISFISPVIDKKTRTVRIRVEIPNPQGVLRPGDYANAYIRVPVGKNGVSSKTYDPELAGKYISPMHPQKIGDKPGKCPICGMDMLAADTFGYTADQVDIEKVVAVPRDATLSVGRGHVAFVEKDNGYFFLQELVLGPVVEGNRVVVLKGLRPGDTIASRGVFLIDSQMQLSGKTSLLKISTERESHRMHGHQND